MPRDSSRRDQRVLVLAPTGRDAELTCRFLAEEAIDSDTCVSSKQLCREIERGAGVVLVCEEAVASPRAMRRLVGVLARQPPWSDLPVVVFASGHVTRGRAALPLERLGNVTVLERPTPVRTLLSVMRSAIRSRQRQYEVQQLLARLEETGAKKDQFMAQLGHELRNPLNAVQMLAVVLEREGGANLGTRLEVLTRQTQTLARIVDDLLDVSRMLRGKVQVDRQVIELNDALSRAVESMRLRVNEEQHRIGLQLPARVVLVDADAVRLEQIIVNLLDNAIKYSPCGAPIHVRLTTEDEHASIEVEDRGMGIPCEMRKRIFDPFEQIHGDEHGRGGLGLGLPLVQGLVRLHQGTVEVRSAGRGEGSTFVVKLPIVHRAAAAVPPPLDPSRRTSAKRVLIVEDNRDAGELLSELIAAMGHEVRMACDGPSGLELLATFAPDLALIDIGLPGMDGYELARRARATAELAGIPLVAMTGYGQPADKARATSAGFVKHLVKPVEMGQLRALLAAPVTRSTQVSSEP